MFQVIEKKDSQITVKMDVKTFEGIQSDLEEDISDYEFIFDTPISTSQIIK